MGAIISQYYMELFSTSCSEAGDIDKVLDTLEPCVFEATNEFLFASFSQEEIRRAVFDLNPLKASGPDGFTALFFQKSWELLKDSLVPAFQHVLNGT